MSRLVRYNQALNQLHWRLHGIINNYFKPKPIKIRPEIISRIEFSKERGEYWFKRLSNNYKSGGNIMSCKFATKFQQARRIYIYYMKQYRKTF